MNKIYLGIWFLLLTILFVFPPCIGQGNRYYVGHVFVLNVGTFVDVATVSGPAKYVSFIAEIAWQKVALEALAITAFVGVLRAFNLLERFKLNKYFGAAND